MSNVNKSQLEKLSEKPPVGLSLPAEISPKEYEFLIWCEQFFKVASKLPDQGTAATFGFPLALYNKAIKNSVVNKGLMERGITPFATLDADGNVPQVLTPRQLQAADLILDRMDNRSRKKKLADIGVSTLVWNAWLHDEVFNDYLRRRGEQVLQINSHEAHLSLVENVQRGDLASIKYFNEITGRYVPVTPNSGKDAGVDVRQILMRVMEIIQIEVQDQAVQEKIANRLIALAEGEAKNAIPMLDGKPVIELKASQTRLVPEPESKPEPKIPEILQGLGGM